MEPVRNVLEVKIKTLTPLWTGGVSSTTDRLHETGFLGSLRWWGEVILRSRGGSACDPSQHKCPDNQAHYCDACAFFGSTGLKRSFYADWSLPAPDRSLPKNPDADKKLNIKVQNNRGWYLKRGLLLNNLLGTFTVIREPSGVSPDEVVQFLVLLLRIASDWGGFGARTQQGYGVVHIATEPGLDLTQALRAIERVQDRKDRREPAGQDLPRLVEFFFAKIRFELTDDPKDFIEKRTTEVESPNELNWYVNNGLLPLAPIVRYHLRQLIRQHILYNSKSNAPARWRLMGVLNSRHHLSDFGKVNAVLWQCSKCGQQWNKDPRRSRHQNCGGQIKEQEWECENCHKKWYNWRNLLKETSGIERYKSLINISHAYTVQEEIYEFRVWGWIPQELPGNVQRNTVLTKLRQWLGVSTLSDTGFQEARSGILWTPTYVGLENPLVLWRESPSVENLIQIGDDNR